MVIDSNAFYKRVKRRMSKLRATKRIIESVLNDGSHKQQFLVLNESLVYPKLINQATDCGHFGKEIKKVHSVLTNME